MTVIIWEYDDVADDDDDGGGLWSRFSINVLGVAHEEESQSLHILTQNEDMLLWIFPAERMKICIGRPGKED